MEIVLHPLTSEREEDFIRYFEGIAFTDHTEWSACYCLESHLSAEENEAMDITGDPSPRREKARELIRHGIMNGFLAYDGEKVVGWCNAEALCGYRPLCALLGLNPAGEEAASTFALYCMEIAPGYRGRGIASQMLKKAVDTARERGFRQVMAFPFVDAGFAWQYHGPLKLYLQQEFEIIGKNDYVYTVRKLLK